MQYSKGLNPSSGTLWDFSHDQEQIHFKGSRNWLLISDSVLLQHQSKIKRNSSAFEEYSKITSFLGHCDEEGEEVLPTHSSVALVVLHSTNRGYSHHLSDPQETHHCSELWGYTGFTNGSEDCGKPAHSKIIRHLGSSILVSTVPILPLSQETFQAQYSTSNPQHLLQKLS